VPSDSSSNFGLSTRQILALLLVAHIIYLVALPTLTGRAAGAFGALVSLILLIGPLVSRQFMSAMDTEFPPSVRMSPLLAVVLAALPAVSLVWEPTISFWKIDGRALIVVAWLLTLCWLIGRTRAERSPAADTGHQFVSLLFLLFITWSALFWLMLIWDVGVGRVVLAKSTPDRLTMSFELWQTRPPSEHLFLIWLTPDDFARHQVYPNHLHPYLLLIYGCTRLVQLVTGLPLWVGRNLTPFLIAAIGIISAALAVGRARVVSPENGPKFYVSLFLLLGLFISVWHYWTALYRVNFDNLFPLIAYLNAIVWASTQPNISNENAGVVMASTAVFAAFGWIYTPLVILALWCYFGRRAKTPVQILANNRTLVAVSAIAGTVAAVTYAVPLLLVAIKGYTTSGSPFTFRAGLDGDIRYFQHAAQAVFRPYSPEARTPWTLIFPAFVPLLVSVMCGSRTARIRSLSQFGFLAAPYFFSLAIFPQSVSIHPYLYDQLLVFPAVLTGVTNCLAPPFQRAIRGPYVLGAILLMAMLLMSNFIAIAQGMQKALAP
jgi:hypothetical protein